ncbi:MAG TPA: N-formylglutamate deformylase [Caulobacteraceae bacterium]|nr:N-formylglutamate deformylase [Caulobacteraceae bacterium]
MTSDPNDWLAVNERDAPLIVAFPHTGTDIPADIDRDLASSPLARQDADWWLDRLYDFAASLGATTVRTSISRTVIDVNRDPSGASLYPGQATTELCPTTTFDGEPLYRTGRAPDPAHVDERRRLWFEPYHAALADQIARLRSRHGRVVLYDAHSIRSIITRLFEGELPHFNIGTYGGASCDPVLTASIEAACAVPGFTQVTNGRFQGGWTTRRHGRPAEGVHAIQMEMACRAYMDEPEGPLTATNWPPPYDPDRATPARAVLAKVLETCIAFALEAS